MSVRLQSARSVERLHHLLRDDPVRLDRVPRGVVRNADRQLRRPDLLRRVRTFVRRDGRRLLQPDRELSSGLQLARRIQRLQPVLQDKAVHVDGVSGRQLRVEDRQLRQLDLLWPVRTNLRRHGWRLLQPRQQLSGRLLEPGAVVGLQTVLQVAAVVRGDGRQLLFTDGLVPVGLHIARQVQRLQSVLRFELKIMRGGVAPLPAPVIAS